MLSIILGIVALVAGGWGLWIWWPFFVKALQASVPALFVLGGLITICFGISSVRDEAARKRETSKSEEKEEPKAEKEEKE